MRLQVLCLTLAVAASSLTAAGRARAQGVSPCRDADSLSAVLVDIVTKYTAATDPYLIEARDSLRLPNVPANQVVLVSKRSVCRDAVTAYAAHATGNTATLSGRVYVVQAGSTYIVWDPDYAYSQPDAATIMTFDLQFNLLSIFPR